MSVFDSIKAAVLRAEGSRIEEAYSSTDQVAVEMSDLANEVAQDIVSGFDWRDLTKIETFAGDGVTESFPKPADYDRMVKASFVDDGDNWFWSYTPFTSVNEWMRYTNGGFGIMSPGGWILIGGEFQFYPAPPGSTSFPYISKNYALSEAGTPKAAFTADDDTFVLPDRLMTLGLIWKWKAQKGLEYSEDLQSYEIALAQEQGRDKGARVIRETRPSHSMNVGPAYPWKLG